MYRTWYSVSSQWPHRSSLDRPKEIQHVKMSCEYLWLEGRTKGGDIKSSLYDDYAARGKSMQHFHGIVKASVFVPMGSTPTFYNEDTWCVLCGNARDSQWYAGNDQDIVVCIDPCISHHTPKSGLRHTWPQVTTRHIGANRRYAYVFPPPFCVSHKCGSLRAHLRCSLLPSTSGGWGKLKVHIFPFLLFAESSVFELSAQVHVKVESYVLR